MPAPSVVSGAASAVGSIRQPHSSATAGTVDAVAVIKTAAKAGDPVLGALSRMLDSVTQQAALVKRGTAECRRWSEEFSGFCESAVGALAEIERSAGARKESGPQPSTPRASGAFIAAGPSSAANRNAVTRASLMDDIAKHIASGSSLDQLYLKQLTKDALAADVQRKSGVNSTRSSGTLSDVGGPSSGRPSLALGASSTGGALAKGMLTPRATDLAALDFGATSRRSGRPSTATVALRQSSRLSVNNLSGGVTPPPHGAAAAATPASSSMPPPQLGPATTGAKRTRDDAAINVLDGPSRLSTRAPLFSLGDGDGAMSASQFLEASPVRQSAPSFDGFIPGTPGGLIANTAARFAAVTAASPPPLPLPQGRSAPLPAANANAAESLLSRRSSAAAAHGGASLGGVASSSSHVAGIAANSAFVDHKHLNERHRMLWMPWTIPQPHRHGVTLSRTTTEKYNPLQTKNHAVLDMCDLSVTSADVLRMWRERTGHEILAMQVADAGVSATVRNVPVAVKKDTAAGTASSELHVATPPPPSVSPLLGPAAKQRHLFLHNPGGGDRNTDARLLTALVHYGVVWSEQLKLPTTKASPTLLPTSGAGGIPSPAIGPDSERSATKQLRTPKQRLEK